MISVNDVARTCHEVNRAYCTGIGDFSQASWDEAATWQRQSAIAGVEYFLRNPAATPEQQHNEWMGDKIAAGWSYGETKNPDLKLHPCLVPYHRLPAAQQVKDLLFQAVCRSLKDLVA